MLPEENLYLKGCDSPSADASGGHAAFPNRNVITRAVGTEESVLPECFRENASDGSFVILCSDGLTNFVSNEEIKDIITKDSKNMDQITLNIRVKKLIDLANANGGADNITAAVIKL